MNIYYKFYCKAYDWYNTTGNKKKESLRLSAITLLSTMPFFNIIPIIVFFSVLNKHTFMNEWGGLSSFLLILIFNFLLINLEKSDSLRDEYLLLNDSTRKKINI